MRSKTIIDDYRYCRLGGKMVESILTLFNNTQIRVRETLMGRVYVVLNLKKIEKGKL